MWESTEEELKIISENTVDFLGVNYYQPRRIKARETEFDISKNGWLPDKYFENYEMSKDFDFILDSLKNKENRVYFNIRLIEN